MSARQLRKEWKYNELLKTRHVPYASVMNITCYQAEKIREFCEGFYKNLDFAHNIEHMQKTVSLAEFLAKEEDANLHLCRLGAMVHQFHDTIDELKEFLKTLDLDALVFTTLIECAEFRPCHPTSKRTASKEARVVYDADALQCLGPYGIIREITCNIKARQKPLEKSITDTRDVEQLLYDSLQTQTAKRIIEKPHKLMQDFWRTYDCWQKNAF